MNSWWARRSSDNRVGVAAMEEIEGGVGSARQVGAKEIALLKRAVSYAALAREMNLRRIPEASGQRGMREIGPGISLCRDLVGAR